MLCWQLKRRRISFSRPCIVCKNCGMFLELFKHSIYLQQLSKISQPLPPVNAKTTTGRTIHSFSIGSWMACMSSGVLINSGRARMRILTSLTGLKVTKQQTSSSDDGPCICARHTPQNYLLQLSQCLLHTPLYVPKAWTWLTFKVVASHHELLFTCNKLRKGPLSREEVHDEILATYVCAKRDSITVESITVSTFSQIKHSLFNKITKYHTLQSTNFIYYFYFNITVNNCWLT